MITVKWSFESRITKDGFVSIENWTKSTSTNHSSFQIYELKLDLKLFYRRLQSSSWNESKFQVFRAHTVIFNWINRFQLRDQFFWNKKDFFKGPDLNLKSTAAYLFDSLN